MRGGTTRRGHACHRHQQPRPSIHYRAQPRNTGAYTNSNVPSGFYTVRFTAAPGFVALSSAMPLVQTSQTATAGTTFMTYTNAASGIHGLVT